MKLKEFYDVVQGDYDEVMSRLMTEKRVFKYLGLLEMSTDYEAFNTALAESRFEDAFRFIHTIKGNCLNLGVGKLAKSSSELCEMFRNGAPTEDYSELKKTVDEDFAQVRAALKELERE